MRVGVVAVMVLLSAGIAAEAMSYSFVSKASGRLGGPIRFEFYRDSTTRPTTDIESFTVSMRTADDRWKAMWSILSGRGLTQPIEYGVTPPGFTTMIHVTSLVATLFFLRVWRPKRIWGFGMNPPSMHSPRKVQTNIIQVDKSPERGCRSRFYRFSFCAGDFP